jgi:hypothetical protein
VIDAVDQAVRDRRRGAQHDDEGDRLLAQPEEQDREWEPRDRGHGLEAHDQRSDRRA